MKVTTLFTIVIITLSIQANAANYYFSDSQGDDSRTSMQAQNPSTPWKSLSKLNSYFQYLQPGDKVLFKMGDTFYGSLTTTKSGTASSPIVLSYYGSGTAMPTIGGFAVVSTWTSVGNGIYESNTLPTGSALNMVTINGQQYAMGRYPNATSANGGYLSYESHGSNSITDNEGTLNSTWAKAQLVVRTTHGTIGTSAITNVSGKTISYNPSFDYNLTDRYGYFVQNDIKTLDQFGEWYYNTSTHKLSVYFGSNNPSSYTVRASAVEILLTVHSSNILLDGLQFRGANSYAIYADWQGTNNVQIKNCNIYFSGIDAVALAGTTDFLMDKCLIQNSNSNGIDMFYNNVNPIIRNTTIKNTATYKGMMKKDIGSRYGIAIYASSGFTALNNNIINTGYSGIYFTGNNILIQNNFINNFCTNLDDGGGIYTWGGGSNPTNYNRKVIGNIVLNGKGAKEGTYSSDPNYVPAEGIYMDVNAINVEILKNTIANCADAGIYIHDGRGITIKSNVIYNNNYMQIGFQDGSFGNGVSGGITRGNQLFAKSKSQLILKLASDDNNFSSFGSFDSNYYCRPLKEDKINFTNWFHHQEAYYTLSEWQSTFNQDRHTKKTPVSIADTSAILFQYNASTSNKTVTLNGTYVGLNSVKYSNSVTLAPYTSIILLKTSTSIADATTNSSVKGLTDLDVKAYPNPSSNYFNVSVRGNSVEPMTLRVINISGKLVQIMADVSANSTLPVGEDLAPGTYILELIQGNKKIAKKVIKLLK